jgi:hypothetical protein
MSKLRNAENNTQLIEQAGRELRDGELDIVSGGIIAVLVGMLTPSIPIPPPGPDGYRR